LKLTTDSAETSELQEVESQKNMPTDVKAGGEPPERLGGGRIDIVTQRTETLRSPM